MGNALPSHVACLRPVGACFEFVCQLPPSFTAACGSLVSVGGENSRVASPATPPVFTIYTTGMADHGGCSKFGDSFIDLWHDLEPHLRELVGDRNLDVHHYDPGFGFQRVEKALACLGDNVHVRPLLIEDLQQWDGQPNFLLIDFAHAFYREIPAQQIRSHRCNCGPCLTDWRKYGRWPVHRRARLPFRIDAPAVPYSDRCPDCSSMCHAHSSTVHCAIPAVSVPYIADWSHELKQFILTEHWLTIDEGGSVVISIPAMYESWPAVTDMYLQDDWKCACGNCDSGRGDGLCNACRSARVARSPS